jgi:hypothetical protein
MKTNAYLHCGPGDFEVQGSGGPNHELGRRKGTDRSFPVSMISFNLSEDMEGEREKVRRC